MKEYVIAASQIVAGYRRQVRSRNENVSPSGTTYEPWSAWNNSAKYDDSSNRIKYEYSSTRTYIGTAGNQEIYRNTVTYDRYRIDITFDISDVPVNRIQSIAFRARLTGKNEKTPRGYYISSVGDTGGTFDSQHPHFYPQTQLGNCALGTPESMPYTHDTVLSALSSTGWYTIWNGTSSESDYAYDELLAFSMTNFYLVITTDEASGSTYTITYNKGTYGTGTNTTDTKTEDVAIHLLGAIFTRTDYTQTGWSINADGSTKDYDLNENYSANANITLYPYWTRGHVATGNVLFIMTENGLEAII